MELASRKVGLHDKILSVTKSLERARAVRVALKAQEEQLDALIDSLDEKSAIRKSRVEAAIEVIRAKGNVQ